tara:strand:- start:226 stop:441 length:216 start_codon:yes stop_codon:yes gene_type:complete
VHDFDGTAVATGLADLLDEDFLVLFVFGEVDEVGEGLTIDLCFFLTNAFVITLRFVFARTLLDFAIFCTSR